MACCAIWFWISFLSSLNFKNTLFNSIIFLYCFNFKSFSFWLYLFFCFWFSVFEYTLFFFSLIIFSFIAALSIFLSKFCDSFSYCIISFCIIKISLLSFSFCFKRDFLVNSSSFFLSFLELIPLSINSKSFFCLSSAILEVSSADWIMAIRLSYSSSIFWILFVSKVNWSCSDFKEIRTRVSSAFWFSCNAWRDSWLEANR